MEVLALQYRRKGKRLQLIILPYSFNISGAALLRFVSAYDKDVDPVKGWRVYPIAGQRTTLKINDLDDFVADSSTHEIFNSQWMTGAGLGLEAKGLVDTKSWDFGDLVGGRVPRELLTRIHEQVDKWA